MDTSHSVVIVGGGPVGVGLAVDLGLRGVSCTVVERRTELSSIPKGQGLSQRTLEHFWSWGIADELRAARTMTQGHPIGQVTVYESLLGEFWHAAPGRELVQPYYFQANERLPQYRTEQVLRRRMAQLPSVADRFGWTATAVEQDEAGVRVSVERDGEQQVLDGAYVVGCDGGRSLVREQAGIAQGGTDFGEVMALVVFRSRELHEALERFPKRSTYRVVHPDLKGYWLFFGRVDVGEQWFFHAPVPADTSAGGFDAESLLHRAAGFPFACDIEHVGFWDLRVQVAQEYRHGRALLAGDAAHTHPPYGGFGLNNGLEDAVNLGWKLTAVLEGWGGDARDREKFARVFEEIASSFGRQQRGFEPHYEGSPVVVGPPGGVTSAHGVHRFEARAGHHLAPQPLSCGRNVFEALGRGFTLLALDADEAAVTAVEQAAAAAGVPLTTVRDSAAGGREAYAASLVLVRPDQYVVWTGDGTPGDARRVLATVTGA